MKLATSMLLGGFGALLSITGCSSQDTIEEPVASVQQGLVSCDGITVCGDDCSAWTCLGTTCVKGKPIKSGNDECTSAAKGQPPGHCAFLDVDHKVFGCCTGCLEQPTRGVFECRVFANQDVKGCGKGGVACDACQPDNCNEPTACKLGTCVLEPVPDDTACLDKSGVCYKGACCAGCIDTQGACQVGTAATACGVSIAGKPHAECQTCVDSDACTTDVCKEGACGHGKSPDNTPCLDANLCDGAESCLGGVCKDEANFKCPTDNNVCHAPSCDSVKGCGQTLLTGTDCPDANKCNGTEKCSNGVCNVAGTPLSCDDKNPCTVDDCDPKTGCTHVALTPGESCDNGNLCDGIGVCDENVKCVIKPSPSCEDGDPCTDNTCDPGKGCVPSFNTAACNDGDPCTTVDKCDGKGSCVGSSPLKCDDGNSCTTDSCVKGEGCTAVAGNENGQCDDGNDCSTGDKCVKGVCKSTGGTMCPDDTNPCTVASCDPSNGNACGQTNDNSLKCQVDKCHTFTQCSNGVCPQGEEIDCDDANPCTTDGCDKATGCTHEPDDKATCNDGDLCTEGDACKGGKCVVEDVVCEALSDCHVAGTCNPKTGLCDAPRADSGTACDADTGKCDDNGKCIPNPITGDGGAGGEGPTGGAGEGTGGGAVNQGGETGTGDGGEGNQPTTSGGETGEPGTSGNSTGGKSGQNDGGSPEKPEHVFVRQPGGCSCSVPTSSGAGDLAWVAGAALAVGLLRRRRGQRAA